MRWFREDDLQWYVDGLNKALWSEYDEKVFNWKFRDNPFNLCELGAKLLAAAAAHCDRATELNDVLQLVRVAKGG